MDLLTFLGQLGLGVAANGVYDVLKGLSGKSFTQQELAGVIQNQLTLHGVSMHAQTVVNALAQNGFLSVIGSQLHANQALVFGSQSGAAIFGNNSSLTTSSTAIHAGDGAFITTQGNAQVRQNPDGSISFHVGSGKD